MALIKTIRGWWDKKVAKWGCKKYGHCGVTTIETYHIVTQVKNFLMFGGKIFFIPPYKQYRIEGKHKCTACGAVFIGVIVKDEHLHNNRHDA